MRALEVKSQRSRERAHQARSCRIHNDSLRLRRGKSAFDTEINLINLVQLTKSGSLGASSQAGSARRVQACSRSDAMHVRVRVGESRSDGNVKWFCGRKWRLGSVRVAVKAVAASHRSPSRSTWLSGGQQIAL